MPMPRAMLFDLDETLISAYGDAPAAWREIVGELAAELGPHDPEAVAARIAGASRRFLGNEDNRRAWRLEAAATRRAVVRAALDGIADIALAERIADRYAEYRHERMRLYPGVHETLEALRRRGLRLGLITNGAAAVQRDKLVRFDLAGHFDHIQIEEEAGFGKPEQRAYLTAIAALGTVPHEAVMVGDDLVWDIAVPASLGFSTVWHDAEGRGLPAGSPARPGAIIGGIGELVGLGLVAGDQ